MSQKIVGTFFVRKSAKKSKKERYLPDDVWNEIKEYMIDKTAYGFISMFDKRPIDKYDYSPLLSKMLKKIYRENKFYNDEIRKETIMEWGKLM